LQLTNRSGVVPPFGAYLPVDRRRELAGFGPVETLSEGSALFADISGFTELTEELNRTLGPRRGAEELTRLLNHVFGRITAAIDQRGGSIISFGGDSVICWFHGDDGLTATAAGLELVDILRDLRESEHGQPSYQLDIKAAVAAGTGRRMRVGQARHAYMDVLGGDVIKALAAVSILLHPGEVAVSPAVARSIGRRAEIRIANETGSTRHLVERITEPPENPARNGASTVDQVGTGDWILPFVRDHLESGLGGLMGQLRDVVTLFVGFEGLEYCEDGNEAESFDTFVSRAQQVVASYEGMVLQVMIDDKGSHLYAVFGASVSHEDDGWRAVVAATELVGRDDDPLSPRIRAGVAGGVAYVGAYGGETRMTYGAIGPSVNLAARLMQKAPPGTVYVTEEMASENNHRARFTAVGPTRLKGVDHPVIIHQASPTGDRATSPRRLASTGRLVGRERERAELAASLARLHGGKGGTMLIEGQAGIGKTRLLLDFVEQAERMGTRVITAAGEEIEHATAFFAWRSAIRQLFGADDIDAETRLLEFMSSDPWRGDRIGLLGSIIATPVEDSYLTAGMEPELRLENTQQLLTAIVRDAPRDAPPVLMFDDGHWLDSASWAMVERVVDQVPSLLMVIGTRPLDAGTGPPPEQYARLLERESTTRIVLSELEAAEALKLVESCLGVTSLPGPVSELIVERGEGHPYFSEEIGFALRDAGLLIIENGESRLAPEVHDLREIDFPRSVHDVIIGRFDHLSVRQQSILKVASVIGREFSVGALTYAYPGEIGLDELTGGLRSLAGLDLVEPVTAGEDRYRFRHAITRDIAYGLLLFAQRHDLHRAVAHWMETEYADDPDSVLFPLAYHHRNSLSSESPGEDVDRAMEYLGRAGRKSLRSFAHREAIGFLTDALTLANKSGGSGDLTGINPSRPVPDRVQARWEQDLAEAHLGMGRVDRSAEHFEHALQLHRHPMGRGKIGVGANLMRAALLQVGHRVTGVRARSLDPEARDDLIEAATAYERLMKIYYYANDPGALLTAAVSGLNLAERAGTSPVLARIYANMSIVAGIVPMHRLARTYQRRSREVADEVDRMPEHAWVRLATSVYGVGVGDWEHVEGELHESYDLYKRLSDFRQLGENLGTTGLMLTARGKFARVYELGEELAQLGSGRDDAQAEMWGWLFQGTSLLRRGDHHGAMARFRNAERLLHAGVGGANVGWLYGLMAETYLRLGDRDRARASAASAAESLYSERPGVVFALDGFTGAAEAYFGQWTGGQDRASSANRAAAERAVKKLVKFSKVFPIGRPAAHRYAGRIEEQLGDENAAVAHWSKALKAARDLGMPFEEAVTSMNMGRVQRDRDRLGHALELFEEIGAQHFVELTRAELRRV
jgi:class 3 adenylate cyclase/tetratricopeptide (TPR) repeat protein